MSVWRLRMRRKCDSDGVVLYRPRNGYGADGFSHFQNFALSENAFNFGLLIFRGSIQDRMKAIDGGIVHLQLHKKTVELRFRQRIRSFHLKRVLRSQYKEW